MDDRVRILKGNASLRSASVAAPAFFERCHWCLLAAQGGHRDDHDNDDDETTGDGPGHADALPVAPVANLSAAGPKGCDNLVDARVLVHDAAGDLARESEALHHAGADREVDP